ncbi:MAG: methyltransferase domain-containing protein [Candidatus Dadabacteria bacterium]|nr:methyltransferase domain-containing protein [Candidatus Dadabacteria bacterium]NIQ16349.1 methyltransferase domain-containing protein [Candidatus Dadabacteria bacterium]
MSDSSITHRDVQNFYGNAATKPKENLCCPTNYPTEDTTHIPQDVIDRFYGCGSPISLAGIKKGETVVDLGSGAGIDCFIAAKKVGRNGKVCGIDMTDEMLKVANESKKVVAKNIGYDVVEFKKGILEELPINDNSVNLITSNCVINLATNKVKVFEEMFRVLKDHGRILISDIVSEVPLPREITDNKKLWGECIGGCLTENQLISSLERAGLHGIEILEKTFWRTEKNINFYSVSIRAHKFQKNSTCVFIGQKAIYNGPFKVIIDDEGHVFPKNVEVEVCTDTALKLINPPYSGSFTIINPERDINELNSCSQNGIENKTACC